MFDAALPFWAGPGVDREHGGFVEAFDLAGNPRTDFKRVRVVCRQIYVFSHASMMGFGEGAALSEHGYRFLVDHAWLGESGGWARKLDRAGGVIDPTPDLYDIAFVLFALAWRARASGDPEPIRWAHRTLDYLDAHMRHPGGEGFLATGDASGPRLQNPHMHLLEASLALMEASDDPRFRELADEVAGLFERRFYDPQTQTLAEYFTEDWARLPGEQGRWIEPGHQFEWAWILSHHQRLTGRDHAELSRGLAAFGEAHGVDPVSHATYNAVRDDGAPLDRGSRSWPNTERMKAAVALYDLDGRDPWPVLEQSGRLLLDRYLAHQPRGAWIDQFDGEGRPAVDSVPTSTLYHVFLAFAETLRIAPHA